MRQLATGITQNLGNRNRKKDRTAVRFSSVLWIFSVHRTEPANTSRGSGVAFRAALQVPTDAMSFARPFLMMSCGFGGREGKKTMFYSVLSYLMGTQITRKGACKCAPSKLNIQPPIKGSAQGKAYGFWLRRGIGYGVWEVYGLCYAFPHEPTWWTQNAMGFERLWVFRGMG
jgi:hypothetical protein